MPLMLSHWGTSTPKVEQGRLVAMEPVGSDPNPSGIDDNYIGTIDSALRISQPMVREGWLNHDKGFARGEDRFVPVSWKVATELAASEITRITSAHGNRAIFGGSYGWASAGRFHHAQSQLHRFLNIIGGYTRSVNSHSHAALEVALPHVIGNLEGLGEGHTPWELIAGHTELFIAFGGLPPKNAQVSAGGVSRHRVPAMLAEARASGTTFINISPLRDDMDPALGGEWIAPRPNTDVALILGLAHVLHSEGLADLGFLQSHCEGYATFLAYLCGESDGCAKDADWAAGITGLAAETIRTLARRMAAHRTMISCAFSLQRAQHGEQIVWATVTLAAMLGQIGLPGSGFGFGYSAANRVGNIELPFTWPAFSQGRNPVSDFIPVARLGDMLEHPGASFDYNGAAYTYPDIRLIWWAGGNPFHHQQDLNRLHRVWKRPETVIVQEPLWNAIARHADIVLPCTLPLERNDLGISKSESNLVAMKQALAPFGQARNDYDILADIAGHLGLRDAFTEGRDEAGWLRHLYTASRDIAAKHGYDLPAFDDFWQTGEASFPLNITPKPLMADFRADPKAHPRPTPSGKIEIASLRVAGFGLADCPGHAVWIAPTEWLGAAPDGALHLISNQPDRKLHSQLDCGPYSQAGKVSGREPARLHPDEAARRGIQPGEIIRLRSERGTCLAGAVLSDAVMPGVVQLSTGAWLDLDGSEDRHGNVNVLTADLPTSRLAQGPTAHTTTVFIKRTNGPPADVRAFIPPEISLPKTT